MPNRLLIKVAIFFPILFFGRISIAQDFNFPIKFVRVGSSYGSFLDRALIESAIENVNTAYSGSNINFSIQYVDYVPSTISSFTETDCKLIAEEYYLDNYSQDINNDYIHVFIVEDILGPHAGFAALPDSRFNDNENFDILNFFNDNYIFIEQSAMAIYNGYVLIHELGHTFGLYHTFRGFSPDQHQSINSCEELDNRYDEIVLCGEDVTCAGDLIDDTFVIPNIDNILGNSNELENCSLIDYYKTSNLQWQNYMNYNSILGNVNRFFTVDQLAHIRNTSLEVDRSILSHDCNNKYNFNVHIYADYSVELSFDNFCDFNNQSIISSKYSLTSKNNSNSLLRIQITKKLDQPFRGNRGYKQNWNDPINSTLVADIGIFEQNGLIRFDWSENSVNGTSVYEAPQPGTKYKATLARPYLDQQGFSFFSEEIFFTVENSATVCQIPESLVASVSGNSTTFNWSVVSGATSYELCESSNGSTDSGCRTVNGTSTTITNYAPCNTYYFRVKANCGSDESVYSEYQAFTVSNGSSGTCNPPTNLQLDESTSSILATWDAPNGSVTDYFFRSKKSSGSSWQTVLVPSTDRSINLSGLESCQDYEAQVKSICGCSESSWTTIVSETTNGCMQPTCTDGIQNGSETGVDCGGISCNACQNGVCDDIQISNPDPDQCGTRWSSETGTKKIIWSPYNCSSGYVNLFYSVNNGNNWTLIKNNHPDNGSYDITFNQSHVSTQFKIKIECTTGGQCGETCAYEIGGISIGGCTDVNAHSYNANATWDNGTCQTCYDGLINGDETGIDCGGSNPLCPPCSATNNIQILTPTCNEILEWGTQIPITWSTGTNCPSGNLHFEYSMDNGVTWRTQGSGITANDGSNNLGLTDNDEYGHLLVRLTCDGNASNFDISDCSYLVTTCGGPLPANNDPCGATTISVGSQSCNPITYDFCNVVGSNTPDPCETYKDRDIWYKVTVPNSGNINVEISNTSFNFPYAALYGGTYSSLYELVCNSSNTNGSIHTSKSAKYQFQDLIPGSTVYIRIWTAITTPVFDGPFDLCVYEPEFCNGTEVAWPEDSSIPCYADAVHLALVGNVQTLCSSCDDASYVDQNNFGSCGGGYIIRQWTFVDNCKITYTHNQTIHIEPVTPSFTGPNDITLLCSQDYTDLNLTGDISEIGVTCSFTSSYIDDTSNLAYCSNTGYVIRRFTVEDECGITASKIQFIYLEDDDCELSRCAGKVCDLALPLQIGSQTNDGPNSGFGAYNREGIEHIKHANWYYFTPAETGYLEINSCLQNVDTRVNIYEGDCLNLTWLLSFDDECLINNNSNYTFATEGTFPVICGKTYFIEWDNKWSTSGFIFEADYTPISKTCNSEAYNPYYIMNFESINASVHQPHCEDVKWLVGSGSTPTNGTGPNEAIEGDQYLYLEASGSFQDQSASFYTSCYDLSVFNFPYFTLHSHLSGNDIGSLKLELSADSGRTWHLLGNPIQGDQGQNWVQKFYPLTFNGEDLWADQAVRIKVTGTLGNGELGDIAIDGLRIIEACPSIEDVNYNISFSGIRKAKEVVKGHKSINSNSNFTFESEGRIELYPGFEIELGSSFQAIIDDCAID